MEKTFSEKQMAATPINNTEQSSFIKINPDKWVSKYADYLFQFAITRINDEEVSKELVQDTFLAALEKLDKFEGRSSEKTWLTAILKNKIIDIYRKRSGNFTQNSIYENQNEFDFFEPEDGHWKKPFRPGEMKIETNDPLINKELKKILQACMHKLPGLWLSVFNMKHMDDASADTICREMNLSPSNFWVIIHRTKLNLRACLQKNWM